MQEVPADQKSNVATAFGRVAASFDQDSSGRFTHYGRRLVEAAGLAPGARVLDVAAGRGALLFAAAARVGPSGSILGIDLSAPMVAATAAEIQRRRVANAQIQVMDAEQLEFAPGSFDAVLCGFGLMFLPHLARALAEFRRVLRPGGVLAVSTWGAPDPRWEWYQPLLRSSGAASAADSLIVTRLNQPADLEATLLEAGLAEIRVWTEDEESTYADEAAWWEEVWSGVQRLPLERLDPPSLERFRAEARERLAAIRTEAGLPRRWQAIFGLAIHP